MKNVISLVGLILVSSCLFGCDSGTATSDDQQAQQQEQLNKQATAQTGMPSVTNFTMRKDLKQIIEACDQEGYVTYLYVDNAFPHVSSVGTGPRGEIGRTCAEGKFTYLGTGMGFGVPYASEYTNPSKISCNNGTDDCSSEYMSVTPQADPDGLYKPSSANGTWYMLLDPTGVTKDVKPIYMEPNMFVSPFKYPFD
jgi:hypothetical protein